MRQLRSQSAKVRIGGFNDWAQVGEIRKNAEARIIERSIDASLVMVASLAFITASEREIISRTPSTTPIIPNAAGSFPRQLLMRPLRG